MKIRPPTPKIAATSLLSLLAAVPMSAAILLLFVVASVAYLFIDFERPGVTE